MAILRPQFQSFSTSYNRKCLLLCPLSDKGRKILKSRINPVLLVFLQPILHSSRDKIDKVSVVADCKARNFPGCARFVHSLKFPLVLGEAFEGHGMEESLGVWKSLLLILLQVLGLAASIFRHLRLHTTSCTHRVIELEKMYYHFSKGSPRSKEILRKSGTLDGWTE